MGWACLDIFTHRIFTSREGWLHNENRETAIGNAASEKKMEFPLERKMKKKIGKICKVREFFFFYFELNCHHCHIRNLYLHLRSHRARLLIFSITLSKQMWIVWIFFSSFVCKHFSWLSKLQSEMKEKSHIYSLHAHE